MHTERIKQLRDFLAALPEDRRTGHFSLESWVTVDGQSDGEIYLDAAETPHRRLTRGHYNATVNPADIIQAHCGSTACAIGWACSNPEFIRLGFKMAAKREAGYPPNKADLTSLTPYYKGAEGWDAVKQFFDLDLDTARILFDADYYDDGEATTVNEVIARLDELIETGTI